MKIVIYIKTTIKKLLVFTRRVSYFLIDYVLLIFYSLLSFINKYTIDEDDIVFVTATDSYYFDKVINLLESFFQHSKNKLYLYDLGLEDEQRIFLKKYKTLTVKKFDFENNPDFIGKYKEKKLGSYAWKPIIVYQLLVEVKSKVVWLDAGNLINKNIKNLKTFLRVKNIVVPISSNRIKDWTHPQTIEYIGLDKKYYSRNNYASGLIGFNYNSPKALKVAEEWKNFSMIKDCIAPKGSNRGNHRQDQAVLTLLLYKYIFKNRLLQLLYPRSNFSLGVLFHSKKISDF